MNPAEIIFGALLIVALLGLAGYFAWRQQKTLARLRQQDLPPEDRLYLHKQVQRRLLYSVLMAVLGFMLVGSFFLENQIRSEAAAVQNADRPAPDEADRRNSAWFFAFYWVVFLLLLLVILSLAAVDLLAIARFGLRHRRQLEAEQRAILESQALPLRRERNGHQ
jgi:hypothetical protein